VTVAQAYIKERDVVTTKRLELTSQSKHGLFSSGGDTYNANPSPKPKGQPKKKGEGAGRGGGTQAVADGEEV
jgi:hypothetical protein